MDSSWIIPVIGMTYLALAVLVGVSGAVAIWIAAINQYGLLWGGSIGVVPAYFGAWIIGLGWPVILIASFFWRPQMVAWVKGQFGPKREGLFRTLAPADPTTQPKPD